MDASITQCILTSNKCIAVVDSSFFPIHSEFISAHWKFVYESKVIGYGGFVAKVQTYLQSAYAAEVCSRLEVLTSIKQIMIHYSQDNKIDLMLESDYQSVIHKFSSRQKVNSFDSKLSYIICELLHIK